ncbi:MFS transporter [Caballeronia insecticola]|uniref:Probable multidrug resistance protein n=1 Tax=Caballeronia insecticola TaxID=758793 RepID=R4WU99_9BURK|nr:MFS transporter [Caballeronia insecticola]BAN22476.1 probable multidrug resistance protein [Caballeronia insecticola]
MATQPRASLSRFLALPVAVRAQLCATMLNSASVIVKLFMPLLFRGSYTLGFGTIGMLMAAYGAGCVAGAYAGGALTDRVDSRKLTAVCLCASGALSAGLSQLPAVTWLLVIVPAIGIADGAFRPANLRLVMEAATSDNASWMQGLHRICFNLGVALASVAAAALSGIGYPILFAAAGIANVLGGGLVICHASNRARVTDSRLSRDLVDARAVACGSSSAAASPWADRAFLLFVLGQLIALGIFDQMYGAFGLFLSEDYRLDARWIGYLFSFNALLIVVAQAPAMVLIDRIGLVAASRWGTLLLAVAFPLLNVGHGPAQAIATMACITAAEILLTPAWTLAVMNHSDGRDRGRYLGIFTAAWLGHSLYGPAAGTLIYGTLGGCNLWWACAAAGLVVWTLHRRVIGRLSHQCREDERSIAI